MSKVVLSEPGESGFFCAWFCKLRERCSLLGHSLRRLVSDCWASRGFSAICNTMESTLFLSNSHNADSNLMDVMFYTNNFMPKSAIFYCIFKDTEETYILYWNGTLVWSTLASNLAEKMHLRWNNHLSIRVRLWEVISRYTIVKFRYKW